MKRGELPCRRAAVNDPTVINLGGAARRRFPALVAQCAIFLWMLFTVSGHYDYALPITLTLIL